MLLWLLIILTGFLKTLRHPFSLKVRKVSRSLQVLTLSFFPLPPSVTFSFVHANRHVHIPRQASPFTRGQSVFFPHQPTTPTCLSVGRPHPSLQPPHAPRKVLPLSEHTLPPRSRPVGHPRLTLSKASFIPENSMAWPEEVRM